MTQDASDISPIGRLPEWMAGEVKNFENILTTNGKLSFNKFLISFDKLAGLIDALPKEVSVFELYKITPAGLSTIFPEPFSALTHACEALTIRWAFQHAYKTSAMLDGFVYGLERGNFLLALSCARSIFEELAHMHYFLTRNEASYNDLTAVVDREAQRFKKGKPPAEQWKKDFLSLELQTIQRLIKSLEGSDFDWNELMRQLVSPDNVNIYEQIIRRDTIRKTHINDCIDSLEKKGLAAKRIYDLLSEMVHPNFGSNSLVIATRNRINEFSGNILLTGCPRNVEAAAWFFEISSHPLAAVFDIESEVIIRSQKLGNNYQQLAKFLLPSGLQKSGRIRLRDVGR